MTTQQFEEHKRVCYNLKFTLKNTKFIPIEYSYGLNFGIYDIFKRDFYIKSNGKECYVDTFIKRVEVPRKELKPCSNGYAFVIKNNYINKYLNAIKS